MSDLSALRDAVLKAVPPKPGKRCDAILVVTVWVDQGPSTGEATMDLIATPPEKVMEVARGVRHFVDDFERRTEDGPDVG